MVLDIETSELLRSIGHDGSEIVDTEKPEPYCRRGFLWEEIVKEALNQGIGLIEYSDVLPLKGILLGTSSNGVPHAVAWDGERIFDPANGRVSLNSFRWDAYFIALRLSDEARQEFRHTQRS